MTAIPERPQASEEQPARPRTWLEERLANLPKAANEERAALLVAGWYEDRGQFWLPLPGHKPFESGSHAGVIWASPIDLPAWKCNLTWSGGGFEMRDTLRELLVAVGIMAEDAHGGEGE